MARRQTELLMGELCRHRPGLKLELVEITTSGDRLLDRFLTREGGKGLFVKEIEEALEKGAIDFAVHSCKDLPALQPEGLELVVIPKRLSPWDLLVTLDGCPLQDLPAGARVGTTSLRRRAQLLDRRPDLKMQLLRGNIDTRMTRLKNQEFDAIVLASAGMERLGLDRRHAQILNIIPAPGQGALAVEGRRDDPDVRNLLSPLHDPQTAQAAAMERGVMRAMGGDCHLPLGALAQIQERQWQLQAFVGMPDGSRAIEIKRSAPLERCGDLVQEIVSELEKRGAREIMAKCAATVI